MTRLNPEQRYFRWPSHLLPPAPVGSPDPTITSDRQIAERLGTHRSFVARLREGGLDYWWADRLATHVLGLHPQDVWPNWKMRTTLAIVMDDVA